MGFIFCFFREGLVCISRTIPKGVIGLGAGAYGETGRGIQEYHELIANHASTIMDSAVPSTTPYYNRFSCCHGADDAYARM